MSNAVAGARGRLDKIGKLAELLKRAAPEEIRHRRRVSVRVRFRKGASASDGRSCRRRAPSTPAAEPSLELRETHDTFDRIASIEAARARRASRAQLLTDLFRPRDRAANRIFSCACCRASCVRARRKVCSPKPWRKPQASPAAAVRQAAMMCGDLGEVACAALVEGVSRAVEIRDPAIPSGRADARVARRKRGGGAGGVRRGGVRAEARWRAHPGAQVRRRGARVLARAARRDGRGAGGRRGRQALAGPRDHPRWRSAGAAARRHAVAVSGDDAPVRPAAGRRSAPIGAAVDAVLLRLSVHRRPSAHCRAATRTVCALIEARRRRVCRSTSHHQRRARRVGVLRSTPSPAGTKA